LNGPVHLPLKAVSALAGMLTAADNNAPNAKE